MGTKGSTMSVAPNNRGNKMSLAIFGLGFVLCVGGFYIFLKSDDTAFVKTQQDVIQFRGEIKTQLTELMGLIKGLDSSNKTFAEKCDQNFEALRDADSRLQNTVGALELEIQRLKEKQRKIEVRAIPTTQNINLKIEKPIPVQVIPREKRVGKVDLLERSGLKKVKTKDH